MKTVPASSSSSLVVDMPRFSDTRHDHDNRDPDEEDDVVEEEIDGDDDVVEEDEDVLMQTGSEDSHLHHPRPRSSSMGGGVALSSSLSSNNSHTNSSSKNGLLLLRRRRALSMAETQPSVETVIVKAKRAAQSLWMLLHAQSCVLGQKCMHTGCQEAKLLHLHLKTCPAGSNTGDCPMDYHGCDQSRKLLAHYRRCRTLRARQHANGNGNNSSSTTTSTASGGNNGMSGNGINNNNGSSSSSSSSSGHHCLVCSLMARQARTVLEHTSSSKSSSSLSTSGPNTKSIHPLKKNAFAVSAPRKMSYSLPSDVMSEAATRREKMNHTNAAAATTTTTTTGAMMPPPPPRRTNEPFPLSYVAKRCPGGSSNGGSLDSLAFLYATAKQLDGDGDDNDDCDDNQAFLPATTTIRRERAVSEAENTPSTVFRNGINTTSSGLDFSSVGLAMTTATTSTTAKRRERSASCGTIRAATRRTTTSPPTMSSISEEEPTMVVQELAEELAVDQGAR